MVCSGGTSLRPCDTSGCRRFEVDLHRAGLDAASYSKDSHQRLSVRLLPGRFQADFARYLSRAVVFVADQAVNRGMVESGVRKA